MQQNPSDYNPLSKSSLCFVFWLKMLSVMKLEKVRKERKKNRYFQIQVVFGWRRKTKRNSDCSTRRAQDFILQHFFCSPEEPRSRQIRRYSRHDDTYSANFGAISDCREVRDMEEVSREDRRTVSTETHCLGHCLHRLIVRQHALHGHCSDYSRLFERHWGLADSHHRSTSCLS